MRQWLVDAFASAPFKGNPACVVEPFEAAQGWPDPVWMQALAQENNQAETAFLLRDATDPACFGLRWFTPTQEMPLCGHATLASAHVLFRELATSADAITFDTLSGPLVVSQDGEGYRMDFPADPPRRTQTPSDLAEALGAEPVEVWAGKFLIAVLGSEATVRALTPNLAAINRISGDATEGPGNLSVAAFADPGIGYDVVSRFFAPGSGIPEDPTTGGAHCSLSPLFAEKLGRALLCFHQAYPGRGGDLVAEHVRGVGGDRVLLSGQAVTVAESSLRLTLP